MVNRRRKSRWKMSKVKIGGKINLYYNSFVFRKNPPTPVPVELRLTYPENRRYRFSRADPIASFCFTMCTRCLFIRKVPTSIFTSGTCRKLLRNAIQQTRNRSSHFLITHTYILFTSFSFQLDTLCQLLSATFTIFKFSLTTIIRFFCKCNNIRLQLTLHQIYM